MIGKTYVIANCLCFERRKIDLSSVQCIELLTNAKNDFFIAPDVHKKLSFSYGLFTLPDTNSETHSDSDSKHNRYIPLRRTCSHCTDLGLGSLLSIPAQDRNPESKSVPRIRIQQCV